MNADRRSAPRIPLDMPCLLTLIVNYGEPHQAMAIDVSQGGVQLALPPGMDEKSLEPGLPVTFQDVPAPMDHLLDGAHGKIAWVGARCCGIRLNKALSLDPVDVVDLARL